MVDLLGPVRCINVPFLAGDSLTGLTDHSSVVSSIFLVAIWEETTSSSCQGYESSKNNITSWKFPFCAHPHVCRAVLTLTEDTEVMSLQLFFYETWGYFNILLLQTIKRHIYLVSITLNTLLRFSFNTLMPTINTKADKYLTTRILN